jgi:hypothetical protein
MSKEAIAMETGYQVTGGGFKMLYLGSKRFF